MGMSVKMVFSVAANGENTSRKPLVRPKGDLFFTQPPLSQLDSPQDTSRPLSPKGLPLCLTLQVVVRIPDSVLNICFVSKNLNFMTI